MEDNHEADEKVNSQLPRGLFFLESKPQEKERYP